MKPLRAVALAALAVACSNRASEPVEVITPSEPLATLTLRWTLAGSTDPAACTQAAADKIDISVLDPAGAEIAGFQQTCAFFRTSITLVPGPYAARARLVDAADQARTTDVTIPTFTVQSNEVLVQDIDFPHDSFF
jgi:hypothetical protein